MPHLESRLFSRFDDLVFGFSKRSSHNKEDKFHFNMSYLVGDSKETVDRNRKQFCGELGIGPEDVQFQKQVHGDTIKTISEIVPDREGDALITDQGGIGLAVFSADCTAIFIYDRKNRVIAAAHSGWRGTQKEILRKTIRLMKNRYSSNPGELFCFISPSISQKNYQVGKEFADFFEADYLNEKDGNLYLDVRGKNYNILRQEGIPEFNIEYSEICSFENRNFHSFRRDGKLSGRGLGIIYLKEMNER